MTNEEDFKNNSKDTFDGIFGVTFDETVSAKRKLKDSVFTDLFQQKEYLLQLYQTLHPEDTTTAEEQLEIVTIRRVFTDGLYNDLGFKVADRLIILAEAQSTWSKNIVIRSLMYLVVTYQKYISDTNQDVYKSKQVSIPKPELYVIYTGNKKHVSESITLSKDFFHDNNSAVDVRVKVFHEPGREDIIGQYIAFCKIYDKLRPQYDKALPALQKVIQICKDENILRKYLQEREEEVCRMMIDFESVEDIELRYMINRDREMQESIEAKYKAEYEAKYAKLAEEKAEKMAEEKAEKMAEEKAEKMAEEKAKTTIIRMLKQPGLTLEVIAQCIDVPIEQVKKIQQEIED